MQWYTLFVLFLSFFPHQKAEHKETVENLVQASLKNIPAAERHSLDQFCYQLLFHESFAYALFGVKAMAMDAYWYREPWKNIMHIYFCPVLPMERIRAWEKHRNIFRSKNFLLVQTRIDGRRVRITLINKRKFLEVFNRHISLFRKILGKTITAQKLLEDIRQEKMDILTILNNSETLFGLLLGFGKENSQLYQKRHLILEYLRARTSPPFTLKPPVLSKKFSSFKEELEWLNTTLQCVRFKNDSPLYFLFPVYFVAKQDSLETQELLQEYAQAQARISKLLIDKNATNVFLSQF